MKPIFQCKVENNDLKLSPELREYLLNLEGNEVDVTVEKHRNKRSLQQNSYYFGVVIKILSDELGYSRDEMHDVLKGKFLGELKKVGKTVIHYSRSTTSLNTQEFEDYLQQIREWASAELNVFIPLPNEVIV